MTFDNPPDFRSAIETAARMVHDVLEKLPPDRATWVNAKLNSGAAISLEIQVLPRPRILVVMLIGDQRHEFLEVALSPKAGEVAH